MWLTPWLSGHVFLLPLTLLGHIGFEYAKPTPASRPSYLQFSPPETLVCSSCLADTFISSHFLPKCYLPKAAFWSPDLNAACMDYYYACLPRAYVVWKFPLIYFLVYSMFFLLPPHLTCSKKNSSKGQVLLLVCSRLAFPGPRTMCHTWPALDK